MAATLLDDFTLTQEVAKLPGWAVVTPEATPVLATQKTFEDFAAAMAFVNQVAELAEQLQHHPDITISWATVGLQISSHEEGGITDLCVDLAERIERLAAG